MAKQKYWFNLTIGSFRAPYFTFVAPVSYIANYLLIVDNENNFSYATLKVISRYQQQ
jgi:hypothetical protein